LILARKRLPCLLPFLAAAPRLSDPANLLKVRPDSHVYLLSGSKDPVGQQLEGVRVLIARYRKVGIHDISNDFYPGGRHEMLKEINCDAVMANLLDWISALLKNTTNRATHSNVVGAQ